MHESWHDYINASFATGENVRKRNYLPRMMFGSEKQAQAVLDDIEDEIRAWCGEAPIPSAFGHSWVLIDRRLLAFLLWHITWEKVASLNEIGKGFHSGVYFDGLSVSPMDWPFEYSTGFILPALASNTSLNCPDFEVSR